MVLGYWSTAKSLSHHKWHLGPSAHEWHPHSSAGSSPGRPVSASAIVPSSPTCRGMLCSMLELVCWVPPGLTLPHTDNVWMVPPRSGGTLVEVVPPINNQLAKVPPVSYPLQLTRRSVIDLELCRYRTRRLATPKSWSLTWLVSPHLLPWHHCYESPSSLIAKLWLMSSSDLPWIIQSALTSP